jgi:hypothetical protein
MGSACFGWEYGDRYADAAGRRFEAARAGGAVFIKRNSSLA